LRRLRLADAKNLTFLEIAEKLFTMKTDGENPWWGSKHTRKQNRNFIDYQFKPLHHFPLNSAEAAEAITLRLFDIVGPIWLKTPAWARDLKRLPL
jgi:hypothetical protein